MWTIHVGRPCDEVLFRPTGIPGRTGVINVTVARRRPIIYRQNIRTAAGFIVLSPVSRHYLSYRATHSMSRYVTCVRPPPVHGHRLPEYGHVQHHQRTSSQQFYNLLYNKFTTNGQKFATSQHLDMSRCQICCTTSCSSLLLLVHWWCP